jgi:hypothetical protein
MDIHKVPGATADDLAKAHAADMHVQEGLGVECVKYWFNESCGKVFCLIHAPSVDAANEVHARAHGLLARRSSKSIRTWPKACSATARSTMPAR